MTMPILGTVFHR